MDGMRELPHVHILGSASPEDHHGIVTFTIDDVHPHDIAAIFDSHNVDVRAGHHCAQPLHRHFGVFASSRASLGPYNDEADVDAFLEALKKVRPFFGVEQG